MIRKEYMKIVTKYNFVMDLIGCEHLTVGQDSEICTAREAYGTEKGVTIGRMKYEAEYWLSCYYEPGHCRYEDRKLSKEDYKVWVSETGYLKRLIKALARYEDNDVVEVMWA